MKKNIMILFTTLFLSVNAYAVDVVYRESSGEVLAIGNIAAFSDYLSDYVSYVSDPTITNGTDLQAPNGDWRVLGYSKIYSGGEVRNATQQEIDNFIIADRDDQKDAEAKKAKSAFQNDPKLRRILISLMDMLIEHEFNNYRDWFTKFHQQVEASTSLADFKTRMAALAVAEPMPQRSLSQLKIQMIERLENSQDD